MDHAILYMVGKDRCVGIVERKIKLQPNVTRADIL